MRKLLKRWYVWLALFLILMLTASAAFIYSLNRITQKNLDRIQEGMSVAEVEDILGKGAGVVKHHPPLGFRETEFHTWMSAPDFITVRVDDGRVTGKWGRFVRTSEVVRPYVNRWLDKIGVRWRY